VVGRRLRDRLPRPVLFGMLERPVVPGGQLDPWQLVLVCGADAPIDCMPLLLYMTAEPLGYLAATGPTPW
jgi:hypothetical protein